MLVYKEWKHQLQGVSFHRKSGMCCPRHTHTLLFGCTVGLGFSTVNGWQATQQESIGYLGGSTPAPILIDQNFRKDSCWSHWISKNPQEKASEDEQKPTHLGKWLYFLNQNYGHGHGGVFPWGDLVNLPRVIIDLFQIEQIMDVRDILPWKSFPGHFQSYNFWLLK